jgi:iron complex outermembrane recepter protein
MRICVQLVASASSFALGAGLFATPAFAQTMTAPAAATASPDVAPPSSISEIVVTGFRQSVTSAINAKRAASGVVDVIKSEDIAQFPDNNLADSIQRVPGVSITRVAGEGRNISVRGLGPGFTRVRINGMEAQATSGASDTSGGVNGGRGFDFNVFASELFNSITVRKTQDAQTDEGSLGATVDLQTGHPFDFKTRTTATISAEGQYNDLRGRIDPRVVGLYSRKFANDTIGILVSAAYSQVHRYEEGYGFGSGADLVSTNGGFCSPVGVTPINPAVSASSGTTAANCSTGVPREAGTPSNIAAYNTASGANVHNQRLPRYGRIDYFQRRLGLTGSLQWQPSDRTLVTFDVLYSKFKEDRQEQFLDGFSFSRALSNNGKPQTSVLDAAVSPSGDLVYGVFDGVDTRAENRLVKSQTEFKQFTLNFRQDLNDWWRIDGLLGLSKSDFSNPFDVTVTNDRSNTNGYSFDFRSDPNQPIINYGYDVNDPNSYRFTSGTSEMRVRKFFITNEYKTGQLNSEFKVAPGFKLRFGGEYKRFTFDSNRYMRNTSDLTVPALPAGTTLADLSKTVSDFGSGLNLQGATPTSFVVPDVKKYADLFNVYGGQGLFVLGNIDNASARGSVRGVTETTQGYYGQVDFETDFLPFKIRGNAGVRWVQTVQNSRGYQVLAGAPVLVNAHNKYNKWLPSLNLTAEFTRNLLLRFSASEVLARPELGNLTPGGTILLTGDRSLTLGNPQLAPIQAKTIDVSGEWYFAPSSLIAVGYFHKNISTYVQSLQRTVPFDQLGLPESLLTGSLTAPTDIFKVSQPVNTPGGPLDGVEVNFQSTLPLHFLPDALDHFGVLANYTHVTSNIRYFLDASGLSTVVADLVGLSKNAANATLYFDDGKLSLRGSMAYRSGYLTGVPGAGTGNDVSGTKAYTTVDVSASYNLSSHLKIKFEALNLTDAFTNQYVDSVRMSPNNYTHTGRQYDFGFLYKF